MSRDFWDKNAGAWGQAIQSQLVESRKVTNPAIIQELLRWKPKSVLDLGCGEGWIASQVLPQGIEYIGLDFSSALIEIAKQTYPRGLLEVASYDDIEQGRWKSPKVIDLAVFNFSLFEKDIGPLLRAVARLMTPSGTLLIQTLHPFFAGGPYEDGLRTEDFKSFPLPFSGEITWYARTLGSWIDAFTKSGLRVKTITEPLNPATKTPLSILFSLEIDPTLPKV